MTENQANEMLALLGEIRDELVMARTWRHTHRIELLDQPIAKQRELLQKHSTLERKRTKAKPIEAEIMDVANNIAKPPKEI